MPDFFVDSPDAESLQKLPDGARADGDSSRDASSAGDGRAAVSTSDSELATTFSAVQAMISDDVVNSVNAVFLFDLKGLLSSFDSCLSVTNGVVTFLETFWNFSGNFPENLLIRKAGKCFHDVKFR